MRREIYEQPAAIAKTIEKHLKDDIIFPGELDRHRERAADL